MTFLEDIYLYSFEGITESVYKYRFISEGQKDITKAVSLRPIKNRPDVYNLGFGNLETNGEIVEVSDVSVDNNNDANKVLNSVFACMVHFLKQEEGAQVLFFGNTEHKHILYKQKVSSNLVELKDVFEVYGGKVNCEIPKLECPYVCTKNGRTRERIIKKKDLTGFVLDKEPHLEGFLVENSKTYDFVLFLLKRD